MRKKNIQRLVIAAVLLIVLPFVISQFMLECVFDEAICDGS